jgi:hypothetical protein
MRLRFIFLLLVISLCKGFPHQPELISVTSRIDSREYSVSNYSDQHQAANYLAEIRKCFDVLSVRLKQTNPVDNRVIRLHARYTPNTVIQENIPDNNSSISYSINKGDLIALCLRSSKPPNYSLEKLNTIKFVGFHELAHVITESIDHTPEFYSNFRYLLSYAVKWRLYDYIDYRRHPESYCGTVLNHSPSNLEKDRKMRSYL